jgi:hypothetical protein
LALTDSSPQGINLTLDNKEFIKMELEAHFEKQPVLRRKS